MDLRDQRVDGVELCLFAQVCHERRSHASSIEIAVEVEHVHLEHEATALDERRVRAEAGNRGQRRTTVDRDTARSLSYGRIHHVGAGSMTGSSYECMGEYDDHWVRTDDGWRISRRWFEIRISIGDFEVLRPAD